jgi:hypothetical protein
MNALIQKDLRENLKLALLGFLIFSLMLLSAYRVSTDMLANLLKGGVYVQTDALQPLLSQSLLALAAFYCAIFGAALGWLQTRNEAHRDLWAFLIHRPITRTQIFWGKTIAGLCLYALGAGLPAAILVAVVRWPGHIAAPFEWEMVLPLLYLVLSGAASYFAGALTGLRQARWYGSRAFGLGLAVIATLVVFNPPGPWLAPVCIATLVVTLAVAVWGAFQNGGLYRGQPAAGRLALIVAMTAGCGCVLSVGAELIGDLALTPFSRHPALSSYYQMTRDGAIYKETFSDNELVSIVDLEGRPLLDPKTGQKMGRNEFAKRSSYGTSVVSGLKSGNPYRNATQPGAFFTLNNVTDKTLWFLDRHGKLIAYDGRTRKYAGNMEPAVQNGAPAPAPFLTSGNLVNYYNSYADSPRKFMATAKTVCRVDFKERSVRTVFALTNDDEIGGGSGWMLSYEEGEEQMNNFFLTTRKTVCLLDSEGRSVFTLPYQPGYLEYPMVEAFSLDPTNSGTEKFAVWFSPDNEKNRAAGWTMPIHVLWLGPGQTVARTADLPSLHTPEYEPWPQKLAGVVMPPLARLASEQDIRSPWNLSSFALALVSAGIAWTLARRYNFSTPARVGWTLFVLLLGVTGLLALLCVQEWPARESCPNCKMLRAVDREFCEHCRSPFPPPERNGSEIFAPLVKT